MKQNEVIEYFDRAAAGWDQGTACNPEIVEAILSRTGIGPGSRVLDVACGTGVMIPFYLARGAAHVTGIDISPGMARLAQKKFLDQPVTILCGDAQTAVFSQRFDAIVIYNAFPHFPDPENMIRVLSRVLKPGGTLTVAHGQSKEQIDRHHQAIAPHVSVGLMEAADLASLFRKYVPVTTVISDNRMYQVTGKKPE